MAERELIVSAKARGHLADIRRYSLSVWGADRTETYLLRLAEAFKALRRHPHHGRPRDDVSEGVFSLLVGRHLVFYRTSDEAVTVLAILHERMDVRRHM